MKNKFAPVVVTLAWITLILSFTPSSRAQNTDFDKEVEQTSQLIVMVTAAEFGAGIIFARETDRFLIATAYHVLHKGAEHPPVQVELKSVPGKQFIAKLVKYDPAMDLAVLSVEKLGINVCKFPFDRLGDVTKLKRASPVSAVGNPNQVHWGMPVEPDKISQLSPKEIVFQSAFISKGHSGGGLLDENGAFVGMILADQPPFGRALKIDVIFQLVKLWGFPVTLQEGSGRERTLLHTAARKGDVVGIKNLLAFCGDANARDDTGSVPLHWAAISDSIDAIQLLWKAGTDLNVMDNTGWTPLHWAVWEEKGEAVRFLLRAGAKVNAKNSKGNTALHLAIRGPREIAKMLVIAGADVNAINNDKKTPLHAAIESRWQEPQGTWVDATPQWVDLIKFLVGAGAKVQAIALFTPVRFHEVENVRILLKAVFDLNADVNSGDYSSYYPGSYPLLYWAVNFGELEIVKLLIGVGANVNSRGYDGTTALVEARRKGNAAIVKVLLEAGAKSSP